MDWLPDCTDANTATRRQFLAGAAASGIGMLGMSAQAAEQYPTRPVRIIVPFAPGGGTDTSARLIAAEFAKRLGEQFIVENRPGANGNIGTQYAARSRPDGYTLLLGFDGTLVINPSVYDDVPFDTLRDFAPIGKIGDIGLLLVANPKVDVKTLQDVVDLSKRDKQGLTIASAGVGSTAHLFIELLKQRTGANFVHVPYGGAGPAILGVISGNTQLAIVGVVGMAHYVTDEMVRGICYTSAQRARSLPAVPSIAESGMPDLVSNSWNGLLAPAGTPKPIIDRLSAELNSVLNEAIILERLDALGFQTAPTSPQAFGEEMKTELERYRKVAAGIKAG
jgi:tripartite-type tricarboxylate transporter receptor subunit TctC